MQTAPACTMELTESVLIQSLRQYYLDQVCGLAYASQPWMWHPVGRAKLCKMCQE